MLMDLLVDITDIPLETLPRIRVLFQLLLKFHLQSPLEIPILFFQILFEDPSDFLQLLPVIDPVVLEGRKIDARVVEGDDSEFVLRSPHQ